MQRLQQWSECGAVCREQPGCSGINGDKEIWQVDAREEERVESLRSLDSLTPAGRLYFMNTHAYQGYQIIGPLRVNRDQKPCSETQKRRIVPLNTIVCTGPGTFDAITLVPLTFSSRDLFFFVYPNKDSWKSVCHCKDIIARQQLL